MSPRLELPLCTPSFAQYESFLRLFTLKPKYRIVRKGRQKAFFSALNTFSVRHALVVLGNISGLQDERRKLGIALLIVQPIIRLAPHHHVFIRVTLLLTRTFF